MTLKGFRTLVLNGMVAAFAAVLALASTFQEVFNDPSVQMLFPKEWLPYILLGLAISNILLRLRTDTPVGKAEPVIPDKE